MIQLIYYFLISNWLIIIFIYIVLRIIKKVYFYGAFTPLKKSMEGKIIIVTGSSAGIGKETALKLIKDGAHVIFACRHKEKTLEVIKQIEQKIRHQAHFIELNLSSFNSVNNFIKEFNSKYEKLDILINNAGAFPCEFSITEDKIEEIIQGNLLSQMVLTLSLSDKFDKNEGLIINVASFVYIHSDLTLKMIENYAKDSCFKLIESKYYANIINKFLLYSNTKIGIIFFSSYLAEYLEQNYPHIKTTSVNPGIVYTEFTRFIWKHNIFRYIYGIFFPLHIYISKPAFSGAQQILHLCYSELKQIVSGGYYSDCRIKKVSQKAMDIKVRNAYVKYCMNLINSYPAFNSLKM